MGRVAVELDRFTCKRYPSVLLYPDLLCVGQDFQNGLSYNILCPEARLFLKFFVYADEPVIIGTAAIVANDFMNGQPMERSTRSLKCCWLS